MARKVNFKDDIKDNIKDDNEKSIIINQDEKEINSYDPLDGYIQTKKKIEKKSFPVYMDKEKVNKLDKICKKKGCSRNELINSLIDRYFYDINM